MLASVPLRFVLTCASAIAAATLSLACEDEAAAVKPPTTAADPAEQARIDAGNQLLRQANEAFNEQNFDQARKLLRQASELHNESQRFEVEQAQEKLDKRQAKLWANEVDEAFKNDDCGGAFKQLSEPFKALGESEVFAHELRRLVAEHARKCARAMVEQKTNAAAYAEARKLAHDATIVQVLGPSAAKALADEVEGTILAALAAQIAADLKARRWAAAVEKIDAAQKRGDAADDQVEVLLGTVRDGVAPEIAAISAKATGQRDAAAALQQVDQAARTVRWQVAAAGKVQTGTAMPEDLAAKRESLAVWVETQRMSVRALTKGEARFTHGAVPLAPASSADAPSTREIPHGTRVWVLGAAKDRALVATTDPGDAPLARALDKVAGWVPLARLVKEDTADWLVPDDQLKGTRVWGPLRPGEPAWELGVVVDVSGHDVTVQRLADGVNQKVSRQKLRSGRLSPGTRVLTFCLQKDQPAQVVEVLKTGRSAKLKCDSGQEKEEDLASLRSKPEILPTTR